MFSFHKPRVYRSAEGCCICRAKSSSSRFTDSRKYEEDSVKCFDLKNPRYGEICNACVLLVKRYKRLPAGSSRHWGHVVDARAGPGTKTLGKYKRSKDEDTNESSSNNSRGSQAHKLHSSSSSSGNSSKSLITEKFSKIFKKTKKLRGTTKEEITSRVLQRTEQTKNKTTLQHVKHSLATERSNSVDSDNDSHAADSPTESGNAASKNVVLFQTQTRAAYRSRTVIKYKNAEQDKHVIKSSQMLLPQFSGSKRRKKVPPRKYRRTLDDDDTAMNAKFYDDSEWAERQSCCGLIYECAKLAGAIIVDLEQYKPCAEHRQQYKRSNSIANATQKQKPIIATLPAVVKLTPPPPTFAPNISSSSTANVSKPTPVLKKHHLFFKRQSECFPHGDLNVPIPIAAAAAAITALNVKTEATASITNLQLQCDDLNPIKTVTNIKRHSAAVVPPLNAKSSSFLHKIKADAGKIVKHSLDKLNSAAARMKPADLGDMKHLVKTIDKNHLLGKSLVTTATVVGGATQSKANMTNLTPTELSPASSTTSSTKFSDNSSDSGFDENVQDRKSASPLEESENKVLPPTRPPPVQTLILASGMRVHAQQQNLVYTGNETASKILQNRTQRQVTATTVNNYQTNKNIAVNPSPAIIAPSRATLKLVQSKTNINNNSSNIASIGAALSSVGGNLKMRTIYTNNSNAAIQHENGITTILPASSLAATNQTAAMQAIAPSTVTITPSPSATLPKRFPSTNQQQQQQLAATSTITHNYNNDNNVLAHMNAMNTIINQHPTLLNQKIILLKTTPTTTTTNTAGNLNLSSSNNNTNNNNVISNICKNNAL